MTKLTVDLLKNNVSLAYMNFETTAELEADIGFLGHERAKAALELGINIPSSGYNLFVMGEPGTGRQTLVSRYVREKAEQKTAPSDWCYVNNFSNTSEPLALELPSGQASKLVSDIEHFIDELLDTFPAAFENPSYQRRKAQIERTFNQKYDQAIANVDRKASGLDVAVIGENGSILFAPVYEGKALDETEFAQLPEEPKTLYLSRISELEEFLNEQLLELPQWRREASEQSRQLDIETIALAVRPLIKKLERKYQNRIGVLRYFREVREHLPRVVLELFGDEIQLESRTDHERRQVLVSTYSPNILVEHSPTEGAPVIYELLPSYANLFGRIEYTINQGTPVTNYRLIKPGSLIKASGGYLILDAEKLLIEPLAWDALKLALKTRQIKLDASGYDATLYSAVTLTPQSVDINVKIILIGSRDIYYQLQAYDPEFSELFRVLVDFDSYIPRNEGTMDHLIRRLKHYSESKNYAYLTRRAVERMIEYSLRQAEHKERLSPRMVSLFEIMAEADYLRSREEREVIDEQHILGALKAAEVRNGRISEQLMQEIAEGTVLIDTDGARIGQINGLTVMELGETRFGQPARITATVYAGSNGIVDIEKESELGQAIHSKGVMLLTGYLGQKYAREFPLVISANLAMEQSYGHIDGDSASLAELVALVSAIAEVPVLQAFAVTGSINQHGEVQAIGGVNEKIEGFFQLCRDRGLTGKQGVIIPKDNIKHLMLNDEVIAAVDAGQFSIHAVDQVEQAMEILLDEETGEADSTGHYPVDSINGRVWQRLKIMADYDRGN
ncbi:Lon protease family protein [Gynuella sunshinyii]|uniref:endopeptidase La n=1 Tax=Gynuella sunshinyii YC6258 TaxID=1445510 RepID=A0A0C5VBZ8_9GAMM|nr:ATP-binding protein [Gynuella sunshinyii]AJQ96875.1 putative ATP-dependent protease [Gynuella sunshinyii YC6258]